MLEGLAPLLERHNRLGSVLDDLLLRIKLAFLEGRFALVVDLREREILSALCREASAALDKVVEMWARGGDVPSGSPTSDGSFGYARVCLQRIIQRLDGDDGSMGDIPFNQNQTSISAPMIAWLPEVRRR